MKADFRRYTRRVILEKSSPFLSQDQLRSLDEELAAFRASLPEELGTDDNRLLLMCHSPEAKAYLILHSTLHLCRCDLYRFLIPGIKESVCPSAMEQTPEEYIQHCQQQCLDSALSLCELWSKICQLQTNRTIDSTNLVVSIYQVTKITDHLSHLLPDSGEHSLPNVQRKLKDAVSMTSYSQKAFPRIKPCVSYHTPKPGRD